jgi:hypothetical protein
MPYHSHVSCGHPYETLTEAFRALCADGYEFIPYGRQERGWGVWVRSGLDGKHLPGAAHVAPGGARGFIITAH